MNKQKITSILEDYGLRPSKKFGQNFLINDEISQKILSSSLLTEGSRILEIGPGLGCMTQFLVETGLPVIAVEIDKGYVNVLKDTFYTANNFTLIHDDFLRFQPDFTFTHLIANLPYYCASELIFKVAEFNPEVITVMLQKEMAERIKAKPGSKSYGLLTVNLTIKYEFHEMFTVGKSNFYPRPDIDSAVIVLKRRENNLIEENLIPLFKQITRSLFWGRRKTIAKCLTSSPHIAAKREDVLKVIEASALDSNLRAEDLSLTDFVKLTKEFMRLNLA
ncbi:MAG TPA: 16S rRNA (adenine(1518)-N(6)/adenine(1519)-N(6))-dimethyltransferase RsmA [Spirochaetota bacterium]|nr:16S rRNA (adenine(1518)-N(6)/adenine(1519)-N(6))-dimethyltransferase RsmA [Spirochaetota bacterium]